MARRDVYEHGFDESTGKTTAATTCPECDGTLETEGGEIACLECGLVVTQYRLDHTGPRTFCDDETDRERTGAPLTPSRHDRGLSTEIGTGCDGRGNPLPGKKRRQLGRLRREHSRGKFQSKAERNLAYACTEIARMTSALGLPTAVKDDASQLHRRAKEADLLPGRSIEAIAAASVYAACRRGGYTQTTADIAAVARCSEETLQARYRLLNTELGLAIRPRTPQEFVPRLASELDLARPAERQAESLATAVTNQGIAVGSNPAGVAGACIALVAADQDLQVTQQAIASAADVSTATIRNQRDRIRTALGGYCSPSVSLAVFRVWRVPFHGFHDGRRDGRTWWIRRCTSVRVRVCSHLECRTERSRGLSRSVYCYGNRRGRLITAVVIAPFWPRTIPGYFVD